MKPSSAERPLQRFSEDYLEGCRDLAPQDIVRFLEDFRILRGQARTRSRLISMRVPEPLLGAFQARARLAGVPYRTQIKKPMRDWLQEQ